MNQILIPFKNSTWGSVENSENYKAYRHILSFENKFVKQMFIGKYFFGDAYFAYDEVINDPCFTIDKDINLTSTTGEVNVDLEKVNKNSSYLKYNENIILNTNFLITKNNSDSCENSKMKFWKVTSVSLNEDKTYKLKLDLDVFFTYDIRDMFDDKKTNINNAHFDRFKKVKNKNQTKYEPNFNLSSPNITSEDFDNSISDGNFLPYAGVNLEYDYSHLYEQNLSDEKKRMLNIGLNNMQSILCWSVNEITGMSWTKKLMKFNNHSGTYYVYDFPSIKTYIDESSSNIVNKFNIHFHLFNKEQNKYDVYKLADMDYFYKNFNKSEEIILSSCTITSTNSLMNMIGWSNEERTNFNFEIGCEIQPSETHPNEQIVNIIFKEKTDKAYLESEYFLTAPAKENINSADLNLVLHETNNSLGEKIFTTILNPYGIKLFGYDGDKSKPQNIVSKVNIWKGPFDDFKPSIENPHNLDYEVKSFYSKYSKIKALSMSTGEYEFKREFLLEGNDGNQQIFFRKGTTFQPDIWREVFGVNGNYGNSNSKDDNGKENLSVYGGLIAENKLWYDNINNYVVTTDSSAYNKYIAEHRSQANNNDDADEILSIASGVPEGAAGGAMLGFSIGGPLGALFGGLLGGFLGGMFGYSRSSARASERLARIEDIKNTPDKLNSNGGKINGDITLSDLDIKLVYYELPYDAKKQIQTHFMQFGVNYATNLYNLNEVINTRYYFNFIKAPEVFENIKIKVSHNIKQIINNTISKGITIWHVRDIDTFKGVKNYAYDNLELSLMD